MTALGTFLLPAVPLLALLAFLLRGRYPGCDAIVRFSERIASRRPPRGDARRRCRRPRVRRTFAPRGGLLIALSLAQRPPPLHA
jgi:hypothetical protein